jgi:hypothetical protein
VKACGLTAEPHGKLAVLRKVEAGRTVGGAVECVDINRNAEGEDSPLGLS